MGFALEMSNVGMVYETATGEIHALDDISFSVAAGEFLAVLGPSGCGKSTLLALASGLDQPSSGSIRVAQRLVARPVTDVGIVFQTDVLLDWRRVLGNVLFQIEMRGGNVAAFEKRAPELLRTVGLAGFENKYPFELSGGMRQRVSICRALIHDPPLLLMDEPFGALDALTREQMVMELHRIWYATRKCIVFVTHDINEAVFLADRILVMTPRPGRIAEIVHVDLPHPRHPATRETSHFLALVSHIRKLFLDTGVLRDAQYGEET
jgi:NitT/TauT family transport system ATP-binding protein